MNPVDGILVLPSHVDASFVDDNNPEAFFNYRNHPQLHVDGGLTHYVVPISNR